MNPLKIFLFAIFLLVIELAQAASPLTLDPLFTDHPPLKRPTGERLAAAALALVYGKSLDAGPHVKLFP